MSNIRKFPEGILKHYKLCGFPFCAFCMALDEAFIIWDDHGREHFKELEVKE